MHLRILCASHGGAGNPKIFINRIKTLPNPQRMGYTLSKVYPVFYDPKECERDHTPDKRRTREEGSYEAYIFRCNP